MENCGVESWPDLKSDEYIDKLEIIDEVDSKFESEDSFQTEHIIDEISSSVQQLEDHKKDYTFMKRLLHLSINGYTSHKDEMFQIVKTSSMVSTLLGILKQLSETEERLQTIITAILSVVGALELVREMVLQAKNEGRRCGGDFIIFGEAQQQIQNLILSEQRSKQLIDGQDDEDQEELQILEDTEIYSFQSSDQEKNAIKKKINKKRRKIQQIIDQDEEKQVEKEQLYLKANNI
ncbi:MAG: hypothetical protein EZS28_029983 [Streblomastix strix]|uniref:Uncharacterized protein n=1 Tax=Streblomastix strix TaxID=222440 RepID=A0A5J4UWF5_9EUKA|nr:MAG: hypothetical protein EZS28_029983 [Streblomastix strix]